MRILAAASAALLSSSAWSAEIVDVRKVWDRGETNAFTDLMWHQDRWYCDFREGKAHVSADGSLRMVESRDGGSWTSRAEIRLDGADLRDAKITRTPTGEFLLTGAARFPDGGAVRYQSMSWLSRDAVSWSAAMRVGDPEFWLWRVTWKGRDGYSIGYSTWPDRNRRTIRLYRTRDGKPFETIVPDLGIANSPGENTIRFRADGTAVCLLRRDPYAGKPPIPAERATAMIGTAPAPYGKWTWKDTGVRVGGPNFIELPDGRMVAAVRLHDGKTRTSL